MRPSIAVIDASLVVEALVPGTYTRLAREVLEELSGRAALVAPSGLLQAEVLNGLRKALHRGVISSLTPAVEALRRLPLAYITVDHMLVALSAEVMRATGASGQDAVYIALALMLNAELYTLDAGQASAAVRMLGAEKTHYIPGDAGKRRGV